MTDVMPQLVDLDEVTGGEPAPAGAGLDAVDQGVDPFEQAVVQMVGMRWTSS
jgi:hypothetical protein